MKSQMRGIPYRYAGLNQVYHRLTGKLKDINELPLWLQKLITEKQ